MFKNKKSILSFVTTRGSWSRWLLCNKSTISTSISNIKNKFGIK
uniref:Uncharacterized protein n=1 Tax=viral metagenome TaxID=1070528 RepID=A0A6C0J561_9ZZZZ